MRLSRQLLLLVPIVLVGAMLLAIALLPSGYADTAIWSITGLSGVSILAYLLLAQPRRLAKDRTHRHGGVQD